MRLIKSILILATIVFFTMVAIDQNQELTTLKIYTPQNIYYIDGLRVTNENDNEVLIFEGPEDLANWLMNITAAETNPYNN